MEIEKSAWEAVLRNLDKLNEDHEYIEDLRAILKGIDIRFDIYDKRATDHSQRIGELEMRPNSEPLDEICTRIEKLERFMDLSLNKAGEDYYASNAEGKEKRQFDSLADYWWKDNGTGEPPDEPVIEPETIGTVKGGKYEPKDEPVTEKEIEQLNDCLDKVIEGEGDFHYFCRECQDFVDQHHRCEQWTHLYKIPLAAFKTLRDEFEKDRAISERVRKSMRLWEVKWNSREGNLTDGVNYYRFTAEKMFNMFKRIVHGEKGE